MFVSIRAAMLRLRDITTDACKRRKHPVKKTGKVMTNRSESTMTALAHKTATPASDDAFQEDEHPHSPSRRTETPCTGFFISSE